MKHFYLFSILALAAAVRLLYITQSPPSLYWDEAALGYDAYSVLKTGKEIHGRPWPVVAFESFGDYKPSGYFYALIPFMAVLGLSEAAVRLPSAIAGIMTVWLVYLLVTEMSGSRRWALWSALMLAILPWHIQFSRAGFEVNLATAWLTAGIYALVKARHDARWLWLATVTMVVSMYTYHGLRVLAPLTSGLFLLVNGHYYLKTKTFWFCLVLGCVLCFPLIRAWSTPEVQARINETSLFSTSPAVTATNAWREADGNTPLSRVIHHRYWYWGKEILAGMVSHFQPNFLLVNGDGNPRHQTGYRALMYLWMAIPLGWGLLRLVFSDYKRFWWLAGWIVLATIPGALTNLTPHTLRFLPAAPAFAIIIGLGMEALWQFLRKHSRVWRVAAVGVMAAAVSAYLYDLWFVYPVRASREWQYGYKQVIQSIKQEYENGTPIRFTSAWGRPSIYALFYLKVDPARLQAAIPNFPRDKGEILTLNNLDFRPGPPIVGGVMVSADPVSDGRFIESIPFLDGKTAFYVYSFK